MSRALLERKRQLERTDLLAEIEQGRRVEAELFRENTRGLRTLPELLTQRVFIQKANIRAWQHRLDWAMRVINPKHRADFSLVAEHGIWCPCDECGEAVKRLLRACGVLPKGQPDRASLVAERDAELLRVPRYRRDESDK